MFCFLSEEKGRRRFCRFAHICIENFYRAVLWQALARIRRPKAGQPCAGHFIIPAPDLAGHALTLVRRRFSYKQWPLLAARTQVKPQLML